MKKSRKNLLFAFLFLLLCVIYSYICAFEAIPQNVILFRGETLNVRTLWGMSLEKKYQTILTSTAVADDEEKIGNTKVAVKLFDTFTVKEVGVNIIERTTVIPVGQIAGLKIYTSGVLVVGMSEIRGDDNQRYKPYDGSGIEEGDMIIEIQDRKIYSTDELIQAVNESKGEALDITYLRNGDTQECSITPVKTSETEYKLGLWVRDSAAGIGTMTYYEPSTRYFAALGHGITDVDTGELLDISNGEFITTKIVSIIKGQSGNPGKIQGSIDEQSKIGTIVKNSNLGIYGIVDDITLGDATILCSIDGGQPKEYKIEIEKIYINNDYDNKSMLIKVKDDELIEKTGGIIQGMSGSPIIQNGKFIGAVTNVLVNDPTKGYGIFGDLMIKEMRSVN